MNFENSKYSRLLKYQKFSLDSGDLYLTENNLIISELKSGIHVNLDLLVDFFTHPPFAFKKGQSYGYIANRINSYSFDPNVWADLNSSDHDYLVAAAIVAYDTTNFINATIEKKFYNKSLKRCSSLDEAIEWMQSLREFNQS